MPAVWHPTIWWDWCLPQDEKKTFTDKVGSFWDKKLSTKA